MPNPPDCLDLRGPKPLLHETRLLGLRAAGAATGEIYSDEMRDPVSPIDGSYLEAVYDLRRIAAEIDRDNLGELRSMWRYSFLLPQRDPDKIATMAEGATPLIRTSRLAEEVGLRHLYIKDEGRNPTGSFKDRGSSVTVSKCSEIGHESIVVASSGNLACSFAAYCARAGLTFIGLIRDDTTDTCRLHTMIMKQKIYVVEGDMIDGVKLASDIAERFGYFHAIQPYNLYRVEGKKTLALEIVEDLRWQVPDRILVPTSGCTNVLALYKGFRELLEIGWIDRLPAIDVVQPAGCSPVVDAWRNEEPVQLSEGFGTSLLGLGHPFPGAGNQAISAMRATGGVGLVATDDASYAAAAQVAATEGLFLQPASAMPIGALLDPSNKGYRKEIREQCVVVIGTATGKNQLHEPIARLPELQRITGGIDEFISLNPDVRLSSN